MLLFLAFLAVPLIEIALFVQVGGAIGLWPTLAIVVVTAVLGTWLVRAQGTLAIGRLRRSFSELDDPTEQLAHGAMILVAGALLLTPGFFTDAVGFALLVPQLRLAVLRHLRARVTVAQFRMGTTGSGFRSRTADSSPGDVIDGEFEELRPHRNRGVRSSGWVEGPDRH